MHDTKLEWKISPHLRESVEVNLGVCGILRCKKSLCFSSLYEKNQTKLKPPQWHFHQLQYLRTAFPRSTSCLKVKCQSTTSYLELVYLLHITSKCTKISEQLHQSGKQESSTQITLRIKPLLLRGWHLYMLQQLSFQTNSNSVPLPGYLLAAGLH